MRFDHEGYRYYIQFQRSTPDVQSETYNGKATRPSTTVTLVQVNPDTRARNDFASATVGCWVKEHKFSLEEGRKQALKALTPKLDETFRRLVWAAYNNRERAADLRTRLSKAEARAAQLELLLAEYKK